MRDKMVTLFDVVKRKQLIIEYSDWRYSLLQRERSTSESTETFWL